MIATIFGITIRDTALIRFGLLNEVFGILMAALIGFIFGLIACSIDSEYAYGSKAALTSEMVRRYVIILQNHFELPKSTVELRFITFSR